MLSLRLLRFYLLLPLRDNFLSEHVQKHASVHEAEVEILRCIVLPLVLVLGWWREPEDH